MSEMRGILARENRTITKTAGVYLGILILDLRLKKGKGQNKPDPFSLTLFAGCSQVRNAGDQVFKPLFANYA